MFNDHSGQKSGQNFAFQPSSIYISIESKNGAFPKIHFSCSKKFFQAPRAQNINNFKIKNIFFSKKTPENFHSHIKLIQQLKKNSSLCLNFEK